jgi:hypothetical protein
MSNSSTPLGYNDRYTRESGWKKILFRPGVPLQSAELIELQSLIQSEMHQLGGSIYKEGAAVSGLSIVINRDTKKAIISKGQIYALGFIHDVPDGEIDITCEGEEVIGVIFILKVVIEFDDIN